MKSSAKGHNSNQDFCWLGSNYYFKDYKCNFIKLDANIKCINIFAKLV